MPEEPAASPDAVEAARRALYEPGAGVDRVRRYEALAGEAAEGPAHEEPSAEVDGGDGADPVPRRSWAPLAAVGLAAAVVLPVVGLLVARQASVPRSTAAAPQFEQTVATGDALSVFARAAQASDRPPRFPDAGDSRLLLGLGDETVYVAEQPGDRVCLLLEPARGAGARACTGRDAFRRAGLVLHPGHAAGDLSRLQWRPDGVLTWWSRT